MPYASIAELPKAVRSKLSSHQQSVFRNVYNSMMEQDGMTESRAFAGAWSQAKQAKVSKEFSAQIYKVDPEQRLVYGWAYVSTENGLLSMDHSGECIRPDILAKAATDFMVDVRVAKAMHQGSQVGEVVHSLPITNDIAKALGIQSNREGWIIAMKIKDDQIWNDVKSGKLAAFSIGGRALKEAI